MKKCEWLFCLFVIALLVISFFITADLTNLTSTSILDITGSAASIILSPATIEQGQTLKITITPTKSGVYKYLYFYDTSNMLQDTIAMSCTGNICYRKETLQYTVNLIPGNYYLAIYDYSLNDYIRVYFTVTALGSGGSFAIGVSPALSNGVAWANLNPGTNDNPANGNNGNGATSYYITISTSGKTRVDLYIRGSGNLVYLTNSIQLANEKFNYNKLDNTVPGVARYPITTNYVDNKIGTNLKNKDVINLKFYLNIPTAQAPGGPYINNIEFRGVAAGTSP